MISNASIQPPLLTAKQAAEILAVTTRTLWTLTNCRRISSVRIGGSVRYDPSDLQAFIKQNKIAAE